MTLRASRWLESKVDPTRDRESSVVKTGFAQVLCFYPEPGHVCEAREEEKGGDASVCHFVEDGNLPTRSQEAPWVARSLNICK